MMMPVGRLKRRAEFLRVAGGRRRWATPGLVLQANRRSDENEPQAMDTQPRVGFTASRKVGQAVDRNRARRRLKAAAAKVLPVRARPGYDYVIIARRGTLKRPFPALVTDLEQALQRIDNAPSRTDRRRRRTSQRQGR
jgi:ribonuclease P protein component